MNTTVHQLAMSIQQFAVASFIQGALSVKGTDVSGAALCKITDDAIAYSNAYLVVTTYANVHKTAYAAGVAWQQDTPWVNAVRATANGIDLST